MRSWTRASVRFNVEFNCFQQRPAAPLIEPPGRSVADHAVKFETRMALIANALLGFGTQLVSDGLATKLQSDKETVENIVRPSGESSYAATVKRQQSSFRPCFNTAAKMPDSPKGGN